MTESEIRRSIAEACGLSDVQEGPWSTWYAYKSDGIAVNVPDYTRDLNAMHEAERTLTDEQADELFYYWLAYAVSQGKCGDQIWQYRKLMVHATAAQRAEAFCRVMWPERWKANP